MTFKEICEKNGFKFEEHSIVTNDGYILRLFRIPGHEHEPNQHSGREIKSPIMLQHGFADSADAFIMNTVDKAPAFMASRAGYDVWLGNLRGNKYSREHQRFDPEKNKQEFFDYSFID